MPYGCGSFFALNCTTFQDIIFMERHRLFSRVYKLDKKNIKNGKANNLK